MDNPNGAQSSIFSSLSVLEDDGSNEGNMMIVQGTVQRPTICQASSSGTSGSDASTQKVFRTLTVPGAQDVIIHYHRTTNELDNRWAFSSEVIDYALVQDLRQKLQIDQLARLKRIKICGVPCDQILLLLAGPSMNSEGLEQMDIDVLAIFRGGPATRYNFLSLQTLSIEEYRIVPKYGPLEGAIIEFNAPALRNLYLGTDAIKYICLSDYSSITHLITSDPAEHFGCSFLVRNGLLRFPNLIKLELNAIREANFELITWLATRAIGSQLNELHCNVSQSNDATRPFEIKDRLLLRSLWGRIQASLDRVPETARQPGPSIHFQSVRLDQSGENSFLFTSQDLTATRSHFADLNRLTSPCLAVRNCRFNPAQLSDVQLIVRLYPNIRTVYATRQQNGEWSHQDLLAFLRLLNSLVRLELHEASLPSDFYTELTNSNGSNGRPIVCSLNTFFVFEKPAFYDGPNDFRFLSAFTSLRKLHLCLQTKTQMLYILQLACWPVFIFRFDFRSSSGSTEAAQAHFLRCSIRRGFLYYRTLGITGGYTYQAVYYLLSERRSRDLNQPPHQLALERFEELEDLEVYVYTHLLDGRREQPAWRG